MWGAAPVQQDEDAQWGIRELQVPAHVARLQHGCLRQGGHPWGHWHCGRCAGGRSWENVPEDMENMF